ncbi:hypothetical protein Segz_10 [Salmonella phage Segz_1]|uniref:Uncharacterized protein n=1 Tax=Salmonella phage Segz_1 TaxID=2419756 RepID=A0A411BAS2_9CAUD|nr:hypothetical protein KGB40_gp10 [Salmonella phage Segz_1]QAX98660.1 hypothetical protein Segz_10 [Salmonella phage Segz_1]
MTLDEIVKDKQALAKEFLTIHKCDEEVTELMMLCIKHAAHEAWYQGGGVDHVNKDVS